MNGVCHICNNSGTVSKNRQTGKLVCRGCNQKRRYENPFTHRKCSMCGKVKPVAKRNKSGEALCVLCYRKDPSTHKKCFKCNNVRWVAKRDKLNRPICSNCEQKDRNWDIEALKRRFKRRGIILEIRPA